MPARRDRSAGMDVRVGDAVTREPRFRATDTFRCPRCGCLLTLTEDTVNDPPGLRRPLQEHDCCGLRFRLEVRVEAVVVSVFDAGECPLHGPWPGPAPAAPSTQGAVGEDADAREA